ncbi:XrtA/PEP-CTERM system TPR-repeat protein PrsT [Roseateles amylovorans]|uniref:PEP-CTERM system TPR-repeat protein PrsT n=1 Tax=Roseateles amylovorans TaxID=2978473 RepID=A0ABY6B795_9BURK|nr:XrtA/PEP-CTERM system TPR-repeat protein PrsT [Roseateles amylovorans]UXH80213.1 PEP-CTERM system TPR-repeat protein PrsT [Roseateles amylovorans]
MSRDRKTGIAPLTFRSSHRSRRTAGATGARGRLAQSAVAMALGASLLLAGCFGESAQDLLKSARTHLDQKDPKAAIIQLKNALQKDESLSEARFLLARALLDAGDVSGAAIEAEKAQSQGYKGDALVALQARLLLLQGKVDEVIAQYGSRHLASLPDEADLQAALVGAYVARQKLAEARVAADAALKAAPDSVNVRLLNVRLLTSEGKLPEARASLDQLLAQSPNSGEAWQLKGELQALAEVPTAEVVESFRKAISLDKRLVGAHSGLINTLMTSGDKAAAKEAVAAMKTAVPQHAQTFYYASVFALEGGQLKEATELSQSLLKIAPNSDRAQFLAARVAQANGDLRQAESLFAKVLQSSPESTQARLALAQAQLRGGDADQAMTTLQPALEAKAGVPPEALSLAAEIRLKQGRSDESESFLARAAEANPNDVRSRVGLALGQVKKGQEAQGMADLRKLSAEDKGVSADLALISVLMRKKDWDGAGKAIDALDAKQPKSAMAPELRGRVALARGDRAGARTQFEDALKREPAALAAANNLAAMDVQDKKPEDASKRYDVVLKADPKNLRAHMAQIGLRLNHKLATPDESIKRLTELTRAHPESPAPRLALIGLLVEKPDLKQALSVAQEGVTRDPDSPELLDVLGQVQLASGDRQQAVASFNKIATQQPRSPLGPLRLADLHIQGGDRDQAAAALKRAQAVAPGDAQLAEKVTAKALLIQRPDVAQVAAKGLQTARPNFGLGWKLEGDIARSRKDWPAALAAYRKAEQVSQAAGATVPATELAVALHSVLVESGKTDEAKAYGNAWLAKHRQDTVFLHHLGDVAVNKGQYAQAEQYYQSVLNGAPDNAAAINNIAWVKLRTGKPDEALKLAERANQLRPQVPTYLDTLAEVLAAKGQTDRAITVQQDAVKQAPGVPAYRLRLAQLYVAGGKKTEAKAELQRLADLGPKFEQQAEVQKLQAAIR